MTGATAVRSRTKATAPAEKHAVSQANGALAVLARVTLSENSKSGYQSLVHEFLHYFSVVNPEGWARLRGKVLAFYTSERGMDAARQMQDRYGESYDGAVIGADELARDLWSGIFSGEENMRSFLEYISEDGSTAEKRTVLQTLRDILDKVIEHLRGLLRGGDATLGAAEGRRLAEQAETAQRCRELVDAFLQELETARQNDTRQTEARRGEDMQSEAQASTAASEEVRESRSPGDEQRSRYPQAVYNGQNQFSYNTLVSLPDMKMTELARSNVQGMTKKQIVEAGLNSTDRVPEKKYGWVKQRYTGTNIVVTAESLNHGLASNRLKRNGPYVPQIGQILENAIKVNEMNPKAVDESIKGTRQEKFRWDRVDHVDIYLGVAQYPNEDPYVIRFLVNVYKDGMQRLDDRDGYVVLDGSMYAHTGAKNDTTTDAFRRSGAGTLVRAQGSDVISSEDNTIQRRGSDASIISASVPATIKIADFLQIVNDLDNESIPGVLSKDVKAHIGSSAVGDFGEKVRYSRQVPDQGNRPR